MSPADISINDIGDEINPSDVKYSESAIGVNDDAFVDKAMELYKSGVSFMQYAIIWPVGRDDTAIMIPSYNADGIDTGYAKSWLKTYNIEGDKNAEKYTITEPAILKKARGNLYTLAQKGTIVKGDLTNTSNTGTVGVEQSIDLLRAMMNPTGMQANRKTAQPVDLMDYMLNGGKTDGRQGQNAVLAGQTAHRFQQSKTNDRSESVNANRPYTQTPGRSGSGTGRSGQDRTAARGGEISGVREWNERNLKDLDKAETGMNAELEKAGAPPLETGDLIPQTDIDEESAYWLKRMKSLTGREALVYTTKSGRTDVKNGFANNGREHVRYQTGRIMVFHFAHEIAENSKAIKAAGYKVLDEIGDESFNEYLKIEGAESAEGEELERLRKEFVCDAYGAVMFETATKMQIYEQLGISKNDYDTFGDAFADHLDTPAISEKSLEEEELKNLQAGGSAFSSTEVTEIDARDVALQERNEARAEAFSEGFDDWIHGPSALPFDLGLTPAVLQKLGVEEKKVEIYVEDINHMKKHSEMTDSVLQQIPSVVHSPILVMESRTVPDRLTVFGELFDKDKNPILVILDLEPDVTKGYNPNAIRILNAYGKDKDPQWFIDHSRILYIDPNEERTHNWRLLSGLQLPSSANNGFTNMIARAENTVKNGVKDDGKTEFSSTNVVDPKSKRVFLEKGDTEAKNKRQEALHADMVSRGAFYEITEADRNELAKYFPDLRHMPKAERKGLLKQARADLYEDIRRILREAFVDSEVELKFQAADEEIQVRVYESFVNHAVPRSRAAITEKKAAALFRAEKIFDLAEYLYSSPHDVHSKASDIEDVDHWDYFYIPVKFGENEYGEIKLAVRQMDLAIHQGKYQLYGWKYKSDLLQAGVPTKSDNHTVRSSVATDIVAELNEKVNPDDVKYSENDVGMQNKNAVPATREESLELELTDPRNVARYRNEIDGVFSGELPKRDEVLLGMPPKVLQDHRMSNRPLYMTQSTAWKIAYPEGYSIGGRNMGGKHNLGIEVLKQLPEQLANPLAITNNTDKQQKKGHDSIVIWTDWKTSKGWSVIIPITIDVHGYARFFNKIETAFDGSPNYTEDIKKAGVLHTRKGKDITELLKERRQLPMASTDDVFHYIMNPEAEKSKGNNKKDTDQLTTGRRLMPTAHEDDVFHYIMSPEAARSKGDNKKDTDQLTVGRRQLPATHEDDVFHYIMNLEAGRSKSFDEQDSENNSDDVKYSENDVGMQNKNAVPATREESLELELTDPRNVTRYRNEIDAFLAASCQNVTRCCSVCHRKCCKTIECRIAPCT